MHGDFGAEPSSKSETAGRIEQIVAAVVAEAHRKRGDEEGACILDARQVEHAALIGREQLRAVGPGPLLLPDEIALPLDVRRQRNRFRLIGVELLVAGRRQDVEDLIALQEIAAPELNGSELLLGTRHSADCERALRIEEVAISPADLDPRALPCPVAKLARNGVRRRGLQLHREIHDAPTFQRHELNVGARHQGRRNQSTAQIVHLGLLEQVAALEPGDGRDMPGAERRLAADADRAEVRDRPRIDWQDQAGKPGLVIDLDLLLADLRLGEALSPKRTCQGIPRGNHVCGDHRIARLHAEGVPKLRRFRTRCRQPRQLDRVRNDIADPDRRRAPREDRRPRVRSAARPLHHNSPGCAGAATSRSASARDRRPICAALAGSLRSASRADCRRKRLEQLLRIADDRSALDRPRIARRPPTLGEGSRGLRLRIRCRRHGFHRVLCIEVRPVDAEVGHRSERRRFGSSSAGSSGDSEGVVVEAAVPSGRARERRASGTNAAAQSSRAALPTEPRPVIHRQP